MPWTRVLAWLLVAVLTAGPVIADDSPDATSLDKFCIVVRTYRGHADPDTGLPRLLRSLQRQSFQRHGTSRAQAFGHATWSLKDPLSELCSQPSGQLHVRSTPCRWEAVILVMDGAPFPELHSIVAGSDDPRIWVFAEWVRSWGPGVQQGSCSTSQVCSCRRQCHPPARILPQIGPDFAAKTEDGMWAPHYHGLLYNLTDDAVVGMEGGSDRRVCRCWLLRLMGSPHHRICSSP